MERIVSFIYCDNIKTQPAPPPKNQTVQLCDPIQVLSPLHIPGNFSFGISIGIQNIDSSKLNKLQVLFLDPTGNILNDTNIVDIEPYTQTTHLPREYHGIFFLIWTYEISLLEVLDIIIQELFLTAK